MATPATGSAAHPFDPTTGSAGVGAAGSTAAKSPGRMADQFERSLLVLLGLFAITLAVIVLAHPELATLDELTALTITFVALNSARILIAGGRFLRAADGNWRFTRWGRRAYSELGAVGVVLVTLAVVVAIDLYPGQAISLAVFLLATVLVVQGMGRIVVGLHRHVPNFLQKSNIATGLLIVLVVLLFVAYTGFALVGLAILVGVLLIVFGTETALAGLRPTDPRQFVLLKLVLFAAFYGLVMINWIDLFGKSVPGYGIWLILSYMAPFAVLLVFLGWESWPLATSLGLLVSLMNDVGYYFVGNLLFGFHEPLVPWLLGQLGFDGNQIVTIFEGGTFAWPITSWEMGLSIYLRVLVVSAILYYWWRNPTGLSTSRPLGAAAPGPVP
jgi:hypothetical protein